MPNSNSTGPCSERENEGRLNCSIKFHAAVVFLISTSCALLQTKYQTKDKTPFDSHYCIMLAFFVNLYIYAAASVTKMNLPANSECSSVLNTISQFSGALASILIVLVLVPLFGWFIFALWVICFVRAARNRYGEFCTWLHRANRYISEILNLPLRARGRSIEEQNRPPI